jgi:hypothetical protein
LQKAKATHIEQAKSSKVLGPDCKSLGFGKEGTGWAGAAGGTGLMQVNGNPRGEEHLCKHSTFFII